MGRVEDQIKQLQQARSDLLDVFKDGSLKTGDVLERLGYDSFNFMMTQQIGDCKGDWYNSPHQLAQSDMIDDGTLVWWRDSIFQVWYGLPSQCPYETHGDESPSMKAVTEFLDSVCELVSGDGVNISESDQWGRVIESRETTVRVDIDFIFDKGLRVQVYNEDADVEHEFPYPDTPPEQVAEKVVEELERVEK